VLHAAADHPAVERLETRARSHDVERRLDRALGWRSGEERFVLVALVARLAS
jgi:hypothetical protein